MGTHILLVVYNQKDFDKYCPGVWKRLLNVITVDIYADQLTLACLLTLCHAI